MNANHKDKMLSKLLSTPAGRLKLAKAMVNPIRTSFGYDQQILDIHENYVIKLSGENSVCISLKKFDSHKLTSLYSGFLRRSLTNYFTSNNKLVSIAYNNSTIKDFNDFESLILSEIYDKNIKCNKEAFVIIDFEMMDCLKRYYNNKFLL